MDRYVCIHGHFYQPPRENPWLESVEQQDSAQPFHDWNERISAECYGPNGASRVLDGEGRIAEIANNYARMSFNVGPTLLSWLADRAPDAYERILRADEESRALFSGHGSALAQVYNHAIMPLCSPRDRRTQVAWGWRDFEKRFGRAPEGMWLAETAVDVDTLEALAERGVRFTVLAPHQAARVRKKGEEAFKSVEGAKIDTSMAYEQRLPSGRSIALFFYDGPISRAVAFEGLLSSGDRFASRLMTGFDASRGHPELVHIATDGESYGHHHAFGDMALAAALRAIEGSGTAKLTCYAEFLERHPPTHEVEVIERTSWSCAHGVERWRSDCGCSGGRGGWHQRWRGPLRDALDALRDELARRFDERGGELLKDPWAARDAYIDVILDRSAASLDAFFAAHGSRPLSAEQRTRALRLLEMQRHSLLMYTSCGWFFDDVSGLETVQCLRYAARALQLGRDLNGHDPSAALLDGLAKAPSNVPELGDGRRVWERFVVPSIVDLRRVGAHYALSCLFQDYGEEDRIYCYRVERRDFRVRTAGAARLALGRARVISELTGESEEVAFGVVHLGDHNLAAGVRDDKGDAAFQASAKEIEERFDRMDVAELTRAIDRHFGAGALSLRALFREQQRAIATRILRAKLERTEAALEGIYEEHAPLLRFLAEIGVKPPGGLLSIAELALGAKLRRAAEADDPDPTAFRAPLDESERAGVKPATADLAHALRKKIEGFADRLAAAPADADALARLDGAVALARSLPLEVDLWRAQNVFWRLLRSRWPDARAAADGGDAAERAFCDTFRALGERLRVRMPDHAGAPPPAAARATTEAHPRPPREASGAA